MANPPGSTAPGRVTTTLSPTWKLRAPQTMPRGCASPTSTWQNLMVLPLLASNSSISRTWPTITGPSTSAPMLSTVSTSRPARTSASAMSRADSDSGMSTNSRIHDSGIRNALNLRTERQSEPDVALDDVVHVDDVVAEHQRAL